MDVKVILLTIKTVLKSEGIGENGGDLSIDYGDYLLKYGRVSKEEYDRVQSELDSVKGTILEKDNEIASVKNNSVSSKSFDIK